MSANRISVVFTKKKMLSVKDIVDRMRLAHLFVLQLINVFTLSTSNVFFIAIVTGVSGFVLGFFIKATVIRKHKKRIAGLEEEMLQNHSRILDLEKQVAELKEEKTKHNTNQP